MRLGLLKLRPGVEIRDSDVRDYAADEVLCLCTVSPGEPAAALPRIAITTIAMSLWIKEIRSHFRRAAFPERKASGG